MKNPLLVFPSPSPYKSEIDQIEDKIKHVAAEFGIPNSTWPLVDAMFNVGMEYGRYLAQNGMVLKSPEFFDEFYANHKAWEEAAKAANEIKKSLKEMLKFAINYEIKTKNTWILNTPLSGPIPTFSETIEKDLGLYSTNFVHDRDGNFRWLLHFRPEEENYLGDYVFANFQACIKNTNKSNNLTLEASQWHLFYDKIITVEFNQDAFYQYDCNAKLAAEWLEQFFVMAKLKII